MSLRTMPERSIASCTVGTIISTSLCSRSSATAPHANDTTATSRMGSQCFRMQSYEADSGAPEGRSELEGATSGCDPDASLPASRLRCAAPAASQIVLVQLIGGVGFAGGFEPSDGAVVGLE